MENAGGIETGTGNIGTKILSTAVAVAGQAAGFSIAAFFPLLLDAIPSGRQKVRVENAIRTLETDVRRLNIQLSSVSDAQYKLAGEALDAMLRAADDEKLDLLKRIFVGATQHIELTNNSAYTMSRIIRDISASEFKFLAANFGKEFLLYKGVLAEGAATPEEMATKYQIVEPTLQNEELIAGLQSLGLLIQSQRESPAFEFTRAAGQLYTLVTR